MNESIIVNEELLKQHNKIMKFLERKNIRKLSNTEKANKIWLLFGGLYITTINGNKYYSYNNNWVNNYE